jgi:hypothetical protein
MIKSNKLFNLARLGVGAKNLLNVNAMSVTPKFYLNHVKNMIDENLKYKVAQTLEETSLVEKYDRVYKPTYTIEFNREGEVLLYSCDPLKHSAVYFKYPYVFYEMLMPACLWMWVYNPLELDWYWNNANLFLMNFLWYPRMWYWRSL